jgi:hypothetical protein
MASRKVKVGNVLEKSLGFDLRMVTWGVGLGLAGSQKNRSTPGASLGRKGLVSFSGG